MLFALVHHDETAVYVVFVLLDDQLSEVVGHVDRVKVGVLLDAECVQVEHCTGREPGWSGELREIVSEDADISFADDALLVALRSVGDLLHLDAHWECFRSHVVDRDHTACSASASGTTCAASTWLCVADSFESVRARAFFAAVSRWDAESFFGLGASSAGLTARAEISSIDPFAVSLSAVSGHN